MQFSFPKSEKLKSEKAISRLFAEGKSVSVFPIKLIYLETPNESDKIKVAVSASKRNFKKAVDRNRIKRLLREAYRLNKPYLYEGLNNKSYSFMFIYLGKTEEKMIVLKEKMKLLMERFLLQIKES